MEAKEKLEIIQASADAKQGANIQVLDISQMTTIADYFVVISGNSAPQIDAIVDEIQDKMAEAGYELYHNEGSAHSRWVILDYNEVIVHVFHREEREFYGLERLWTQREEGEDEDESN
ncbi:MAG: ribosome silencing factor [Tissierellia bacterium]|nr:ribosome silencing factor [Tissierellia bacterium]